MEPAPKWTAFLIVFEPELISVHAMDCSPATVNWTGRNVENCSATIRQALRNVDRSNRVPWGHQADESSWPEMPVEELLGIDRHLRSDFEIRHTVTLPQPLESLLGVLPGAD